MAVRKAVIPAAGHGTRMRPISRVVPKELLPVGSKPALHWALDEAAAAGLDEIAIVVSPTKDLIRVYVEDLLARGELAARVVWVEQTVQRGLGDAITLCRDFVAGEPFGLLLPDNVFLSESYDFTRLVDIHVAHGLDVVGIVELGEEASGRYGNCGLIEYEALTPDVLALHRLSDKKPGRLEIAPGERVRRTCGRYVCRPALLELLEELRPAKGELDEVPAYQRIVAAGGALGAVLPAPPFDVGNPEGFMAANAYLGRGGR